MNPDHGFAPLFCTRYIFQIKDMSIMSFFNGYTTLGSQHQDHGPGPPPRHFYLVLFHPEIKQCEKQFPIWSAGGGPDGNR
jgi:hypothetical protein